MIAKIKIDGREYFSYIFFLCICEYRTKAIVFNLKEDRFEFLDGNKNKYMQERIIYPFDYKEDGFIKKDKIKLTACEVTDCVGYEFLINDENLIRDIEQGAPIREEYLEIARKLNMTIDVYAWHDVTNKEQADELMDIVGAFHDSYLRDFRGIFGRPYEPEFETKIQLSFELYGNHFDVMMEFYGGVDINYSFCEHLNSIYLSSIVFHDGLIYWVDGGDDLLPIDIKDNPYISSKYLRRRIIDKAEKK